MKSRQTLSYVTTVECLPETENIKVTITKKVIINPDTGKEEMHYYIKVEMWDNYNFDKWRKGFSFSNFAYNIGYLFEKSGVMKTYNWYMSYEVEYIKDGDTYRRVR